MIIRRLLFFLTCMVLLNSIAFAETFEDYSGIWVPILIEPDNSIVYAERFPSQWGLLLPELELQEKEAIMVLDDTIENKGVWSSDSKTNTVNIKWENGIEQRFEISNGKMLTQGEIHGIGDVHLTYARKESINLEGTWKPLVQVDGTGEYWETPTYMDSIRFINADRYVLIRNTGDQTEITEENQWRRFGNDIVLYVIASSENGEESEYPYQFYQIENGLLKYLSFRGEENMIDILYGKENKQTISEVHNIRPLLNTTWELSAIEMRDIPIPVASLSLKTEDYLMFSSKANGGFMHIDQGESSLVKFSSRLKDGKLTLTLNDGRDIICQFADQKYLTRETGNGQRLYYTQKNMDGASGIPENVVSVVDFSIERPQSSIIHAGEMVQFHVLFSDPGFINTKKDNDGIIWSLTTAEGGILSDVIIDSNGVLFVEESRTESIDVIIHAVSEAYGTNDTLAITIVPAP